MALAAHKDGQPLLRKFSWGIRCGPLGDGAQRAAAMLALRGRSQISISRILLPQENLPGSRLYLKTVVFEIVSLFVLLQFNWFVVCTHTIQLREKPLILPFPLHSEFGWLTHGVQFTIDQNPVISPCGHIKYFSASYFLIRP